MKRGEDLSRKGAAVEMKREDTAVEMNGGETLLRGETTVQAKIV